MGKALQGAVVFDGDRPHRDAHPLGEFQDAYALVLLSRARDQNEVIHGDDAVTPLRATTKRLSKFSRSALQIARARKAWKDAVLARFTNAPRRPVPVWTGGKCTNLTSE